jgi:hypothetical protein
MRPAGVVVGQRLAQPRLVAQALDLLGRHLRLWQHLTRQQHHQPARIRANFEAHGVTLVNLEHADAHAVDACGEYLLEQHRLARSGAAAWRRWVACPRIDRGARRLPDELVALIEGLALRRPAPSIAGRGLARLASAELRHRAGDHPRPGPRVGCIYSICGVD